MIRVLGTAGHVDHGKSALVEALTGVHPDRLREEREREMTIDLGFAWTTLPDGTEVGIIDVPGHRDFIDNMLAGVGGFDAVMLVVAADEGVMPQTSEHLAILDLLEIPRGLVVLSKIDLVADEEWARLVEDEVRQVLAPTALAGAPVLRASAKTGQGLDELRRGLAEVLHDTDPRRDIGSPRLPIDRAFVMTGFGTVVTGTLIDGTLSIGDEVVILPGESRGRIRGLQTHRKPVDQALPGSRVAVNITGVDVQDVRRGLVLCLPGRYSATTRIDVRVRVLPDAAVGVKHGQSLKLHLGAADVLARVRVLERDEVLPAEEGWVQLLLSEPVIAASGDRFILRRPAPAATLGGGTVVVPHPARLHRRRDSRVVDALERARSGTGEERTLLEVIAEGPVTGTSVAASGADGPEMAAALEGLILSGRIRAIPGGSSASGAQVIYVESATWEDLRRRVRTILEAYQAKYPLRVGIPREELRSRLGIEARRMDLVVAALENTGDVATHGARIARVGFEPRLTTEDEGKVAGLRDQFESSPASPPSVHDCQLALGDELWALLVARGEFVEVSSDIAFDSASYRRMVAEITSSLGQGGTVTVAQVRDRYGTSRKYALALLEHLDAVGVTVRVGDERKLGGRAARE
ncbi:MAG TPA: selenocysteine-specific translation elongation factor [Anaerolineales bacterium]|nr:selenocysteine-specific translation elongation factor [Anaerolineales bacterium]